MELWWWLWRLFVVVWDDFREFCFGFHLAWSPGRYRSMGDLALPRAPGVLKSCWELLWFVGGINWILSYYCIVKNSSFFIFKNFGVNVRVGLFQMIHPWPPSWSPGPWSRPVWAVKSFAHTCELPWLIRYQGRWLIIQWEWGQANSKSSFPILVI